ncbi:carboxy-S-adenosyl-L-methionine synthase CmoA [Desulfoluna spongiiphila]|uniref:Carboxy-S-adenosyl-L-methionine synthase n=1 Tax=Desulfoluna spongiiphila TaxID=419481 RepID=A0A1G5EJM9_9BACT|nr:carboxy-S-adenosyl-L-methionine synthase CmoA [Desulfoluna spongiiphila]SCY26900.1 tRNA (cmo5U34)-methyltransferase [Desulfoluna spongiiphila]VVS91154.1 carboxy-s-adenosyl-l-methionine synthase [Desulfoluna spongiiphila]
MSQDTIYSKKLPTVPPFEFNENVAGVFNDMIHRSVPLYRETVRRQAQLAARFYKEGTAVIDLGCSNGNFGMRLLHEMGKRPLRVVAVDNSAPMLEIFQERLDNHPAGDRIELIRTNIQDLAMEPASVVVLNLTLQFLPVAERDALIARAHEALIPGGILLITEKVIHEEKELTDLQQEFYYRFKGENGYSNLEISQKRDALENVLIPETVETHTARFNAAGFTKVDIWQKWFHFTSFICLKDEKET